MGSHLTPKERKVFFEGAVRHRNLSQALYEVVSAYTGANHEHFTLAVFDEAILAVQAEQRQKDAELARRTWKEMSPHFHSPHAICREVADAIESQEEE